MATISLSFPDELKEKLQVKANKERRSLSNYICGVLEDHLEAVDTPKKKIIRKK